ncbi:glycosyltransferase family 2 protein [Xanthobacter sp. KR7-65]|uniref:glycosyltransferase family 2 protein n=1 Tax=Xanthobacter sp. KR7-65 TaxID=3156612 RepID=UPI0032B4B61D
MVEPDAAGRFLSGLGLDRIFYAPDLVVVTGWSAGAATLALEGPVGPIAPDVRVNVPRPDVSAAYAFAGPVHGFLLAFRDPPASACLVARAGAERMRRSEIAQFPADRLEPDLGRILAEYAAARGPLFDALRSTPAYLAAVARAAAPASRPGAPLGHMDIVKAVPGAGGLCIGWSLGQADLHLVDEAGNWQSLASAMRWNRGDIFDGFAGDYGAACADAGFLQALPTPLGPGHMVRLLARDGDDLVLLHERVVEAAPLDPVGYARWSFGLPVPAEQMVERFSRHDGAVLRTLITRAHEHGSPPPMVRRAGRVPAEPEVSLLIPLFGRYDFVEHQLLEFADDPFIRDRCEIIYVVDDPGISAPVLAALDMWWQLYGVPITVVWGGRNRGFSGANNLGLSLARGRQVLFLNSDVVPMAPGWLEALSRRLDDHPEFGLLGTRLLFPSGGVQHDGMTFEFNGTYGVWLNQHPGKGLPAEDAIPGTVREWPAATGACLIADRAEIAALGGFSEAYLIGDFEDSDLCLKVEASGRRVGVCPDIALTHLERQSFGMHGTGEFRMRVMLFNAWLHQERWRGAIERHAASWGEEMPA